MAISVIQSAASSSFTNGVSLGSGVTEGNTIIMAAAGFGSNDNTFGSSSPTLGGTYYPGAMLVQQYTSPTSSSNVVYESWWILPNIPASLAGQTALEFEPNQYAIGIIAYEVAGLGPNPQLDQFSQGGAVNAPVADSGTTADTAYEAEIVLGCSVGYSLSFDAPASPWISTIGPSGYFWAGYQVVGSAGNSYDWQQDSNVGPGIWAAGIITVYASPKPTLSVVQILTEAGNTTSTSFVNDVTAGNTIVFAAVGYGGITAYTMSNVQFGGSTVAGTMQLQGEFEYDSATSQSQEQYIWMIPDCPGGKNTISFSFSGGSINSICAIEVAGLGPNPVVDQSIQNTGASATASSGITGPLSTAPEFVFGGAGTYAGAYAPPLGLWTYLNLNSSGYAGYQIVNNQGGTYSWQQVALSSTAWGSGVVTLRAKPASGALLALFP